MEPEGLEFAFHQESRKIPDTITIIVKTELHNPYAVPLSFGLKIHSHEGDILWECFFVVRSGQ